MADQAASGLLAIALIVALMAVFLD